MWGLEVQAAGVFAALQQSASHAARVLCQSLLITKAYGLLWWQYNCMQTVAYWHHTSELNGHHYIKGCHPFVWHTNSPAPHGLSRLLVLYSYYL